MKKLLIITNLVFISIISFQACNHNVPNAVITNACNVQCNDYSNTGFLYLETDLLKKMALDYRDSAKLNPLQSTYPDATSIWFKLDDLKHFIWEIERNMCTMKCGDKTSKSYQLGI